ncbi:MAG: hypothetical protein EOO03_08930 [Chitinophagaceae bacterium]|nr:MAG: hypothetical protein EOO03_08930 [Chitinophagaceae bacterium]
MEKSKIVPGFMRLRFCKNETRLVEKAVNLLFFLYFSLMRKYAAVVLFVALCGLKIPVAVAQDTTLTIRAIEGLKYDVPRFVVRPGTRVHLTLDNYDDMAHNLVVTLPNIQQIHIYESKDLKDWKYCSAFGGLGAKNSFWECPDLFELPVTGNRQKKWVMLIGRGPNRVQYFVGDFNGKVFTPDSKGADYLKNGTGLEGLVFENFEQGLTNWKAEGTAFKADTANDVVDYLGKSYAGSSAKISSTGKLISKLFTISHTAINFLLAGGKYPDTTCIKLVVDGKVCRTATGDNTKVFRWNGWDVRDLMGKQAHIEIIDSHAGTDNAFIAADHILFSNKLLNQQLEHAQWLDYGPDYYATRTWRNYDEQKSTGDSVVAIGWMGNWDYAGKVPTQWGKGFQSIPRLMTLKQDKNGYTIVQNPIPQLQQLRAEVYQVKNVKVQGTQKTGFNPEKNSYEIDMAFKPAKGSTFGFNLLGGEGRKLVLRYDPVTSVITLDRSNCTDYVTDAEFTGLFAKKITVPVNLFNGTLRLHIFVDQSSIEVFVNDGETVISATTFPSEKQLGITMFSEGGTTTVTQLKAWQLNTIWK